MCDYAKEAAMTASSVLNHTLPQPPEDNFNLYVREVANGYTINADGSKNGNWFAKQYVANKDNVLSIIAEVLNTK